MLLGDVRARTLRAWEPPPGLKLYQRRFEIADNKVPRRDEALRMAIDIANGSRTNGAGD
jgi:hypothetical protein